MGPTKKYLLNPDLSNSSIFFSKIHIFYIMCACGFWLLIVGITWFLFYDPFLGTTIPVHQLDSIIFLFHILFYVSLVIGLCLCVGLILSLPAIFARIILDYLILSARRKYKRVFYLVFAAQYLPYVLLITANVLFYYANNRFKIGNSFLQNSKLENINKKYSQIGKRNPDGYYIFLVPEYLLENDHKLSNTKTILPNHSQIFLESASKPEIAALLIQQEAHNIAQYYAPASIQDEPKIDILPNTVTIGIDTKNSPEFLQLFSKNILASKKFRLTKSTILSNHIMAALKPIHLVLRSNILGIFSANLRWENFSNSSLDILVNHSFLLMKKHPAQFNFVFLSDLEQTSVKSLLFGSSDFLNQKDVSYSEEILDRNLFVAIKALILAGSKNIALLPYQSKRVNFKISKFFTTIPVNNDLKSYRTFFNDYDSPIVCKIQYHPNQKKEFSLNKTLLFDNLKFLKNGAPYLPTEFNIYMNRCFENSIICYKNKDDIYILNKKSEYKKSEYTTTTNMRDDIFTGEALDIYKLTAQNLPYLLNKEEKNNFIFKYKHEIFK